MSILLSKSYNNGSFKRREAIEFLMMVGYGDRLGSHEEVCVLFNEVHFERPPIARSTVGRIVAK